MAGLKWLPLVLTSGATKLSSSQALTLPKPHKSRTMEGSLRLWSKASAAPEGLSLQHFRPNQ